MVGKDPGVLVDQDHNIGSFNEYLLSASYIVKKREREKTLQN